MTAISRLSQSSSPTAQTIKVSALHAFSYCPRLFDLEEVEALFTQDAAVFAGRKLHEELEEQEEGEWEDLFLESVELGLRGRVDALRQWDGQITYEHKQGRCQRDAQKQPQAWERTGCKVLTYACLIEAAPGVTVAEGSIGCCSGGGWYGFLGGLQAGLLGKGWILAMLLGNAYASGFWSVPRRNPKPLMRKALSTLRWLHSLV